MSVPHAQSIIRAAAYPETLSSNGVVSHPAGRVNDQRSPVMLPGKLKCFCTCTKLFHCCNCSV